MFLRQITDPALAQNAYLIGCQRSGEAIIVDPERDLDRYFAVAAENGFKLTAVAETHIHADYLSGARELVERHGATAYLSEEGGPDWQFEWAKGNPKARFLKDGDTFKVGNIEFKALLTAGHTPEHLSFLVTDLGGGADEPVALLSGDFIFVGDVGRPDLLESAAGQAGVMEPSARTLYESLRRTASLPEHLQILPAHGAGSACGKALGAVPVSVLGYERRFNGALREALHGTEDDFVRDILAGQPEPPRYFARMKRDNRIGPVLLPDGKLPHPRRIGAGDLAAWINVPGRAVLDLRSDRKAFMTRQLRDSIFAPLAGGKLTVSAGSYVEEKTRLLLVVQSESHLDEAVRQLVRIGLDEVEAWIPADEAIRAHEWTSTIPRIMTSEFVNALAEDPDALVLDVRGADEFAAGHVEGAVNIAYTRLGARLADLPDRRPVYVHCGSGLRASMAVSYLAAKGIDVVHVDGNFGEIGACALPAS
jgi:hydroxyacylglutathione hydrolase